MPLTTQSYKSTTGIFWFCTHTTLIVDYLLDEPQPNIGLTGMAYLSNSRLFLNDCEMIRPVVQKMIAGIKVFFFILIICISI